MVPFRPASLLEREEFYRNEFNVSDVENWFHKKRMTFPQICAVDMGSETKIIKDKKKMNKIINMKAADLHNKFIKYLPEDVYYDRNIYRDPEIMLRELKFRQVWQSGNLVGQQLAFDIDPENIKCDCKKSFPGFCEKCITETVAKAIELADLLRKRFTRIGFVYSGRGMHVHVFDKESFQLSIKEREEIIKEARRFPIDPWVSRGYIRLMRLPYSLNGLVSRKVLPLTTKEIKKFDPLTEQRIIPKFLHT